MKKGDTLILSEISRLGRNLMSIMSMLNLCMTKETLVLTVKENMSWEITSIARYWLLLSDYLLRSNAILFPSEQRGIGQT